MIKILVVDDEVSICLILKEFLIGQDVTTVGTYQEAERELLTSHFDLIIVDYRIPGGSGIDLMMSLRQRQVTTPAILISGQMLEFDLNITESLPMQTVILYKPFSRQILKETISCSFNNV